MIDRKSELHKHFVTARESILIVTQHLGDLLDVHYEMIQAVFDLLEGRVDVVIKRRDLELSGLEPPYDLETSHD